jgi:hypothetical protein
LLGKIQNADQFFQTCYGGLVRSSGGQVSPQQKCPKAGSAGALTVIDLAIPDMQDVPGGYSETVNCLIKDGPFGLLPTDLCRNEDMVEEFTQAEFGAEVLEAGLPV